MRKATLYTIAEIDPFVTVFKENPFDDISDLLSKDLEEVEFDWENYSIDESDGCRYEVLSNGLLVHWMWAGGDWENPVNFVLYLDENLNLRGYIPREGNVYNKETNSAYGNESTYNKEQIEDEDIPEEDFELMKEDIVKNIEICS